jgi:hypothetical protein
MAAAVSAPAASAVRASTLNPKLNGEKRVLAVQLSQRRSWSWVRAFLAITRTLTSGCRSAAYALLATRRSTGSRRTGHGDPLHT